MKHSKSKWMVITLALAIIMVIGGCKKKPPAAPPPPPPPPPAPTASITANPNDIQSGQSSQLTWSTENATDVSIDSIGKVDPKGTKTVTPTESTSYRLLATGPGGTQEATARVTVTQPPPPPPPPTYTPTDEQLLAQNAKDIFFDYDSFEIRPGEQQNLGAGARFLTTQKPNWKIQIEGYCDERGSTEYNLALGDSRANAAKRALVTAGVGADRIRTISFGKEKPFCTESNEQCWQQNRRAHFALQK